VTVDHDALRHVADSWGLLLLVLLFAAALWRTFRPGSRRAHDEARLIPFRDGADERPLDSTSRGAGQ
jgi:cytochrome c oxidase cbb3-type subunit 4